MPTTLDGKVEKNSKTLARLTRLRITTAAFNVNAVNLEYRLRNIETDCDNLAHGRLPSKWCTSTQPPYGTPMPQSGRRPQHQSRRFRDVRGMSGLPQTDGVIGRRVCWWLKVLGAALQADGETRSVGTASSIRRRSAAWIILLDWTYRSRRPASALWIDTGRMVREVKVASEPEALLPVADEPALPLQADRTGSRAVVAMAF